MTHEEQLQLADLQAKLDAAQAERDKLRGLLDLANTDWAEDDTAIRNLCRPFLTEATCDHDGYAVVPIVNAVEAVTKLLNSTQQRISELEDALRLCREHIDNGVALLKSADSQLTAAQQRERGLVEALELARHNFIRANAKNLDELKTMPTPYDAALTPAQKEGES